MGRGVQGKVGVKGEGEGIMGMEEKTGRIPAANI